MELQKECTIYLESRLDNVQTYSNLGFEAVVSRDRWPVSDEECLHSTCDIVRMSCHHFVSSAPADTPTATMQSITGPRICCRNKAFMGVPAHTLSQYHVALFEQFDAFQTSQEDSTYVA